MPQSTFVIILLLIGIVLFATEKIPLSVSMLGLVLIMYFTGVISFSQAFAGFSATATLMVMGLLIVGRAFATSGLSDVISRLLRRAIALPEKYFILVLMVASMLISMFCNSMLSLGLMMPIVDAAERNTNGRISRKMCYMMLAISGTIGGTVTSIGASSAITASSLMEASYVGRQFTFFELAPVSLPSAIAVIVVFALIGYAMERKCYNFEAAPLPEYVTQGENTKLEAPAVPKYKTVLAAVILVICIVNFIIGKFNLGAVSLLGALLLMLTGCVKEKEAFSAINLSTIFTVACSIGFGAGIQASGAGEVIANTLFKVGGPVTASPYGLCVVMMIITAFLSNFMSNNAAVVMVLPIALSMAQTLGQSGVPYAVACALGANYAIMTPICNVQFTIIYNLGYRFKDYARVGGMFNLLIIVLGSIMLKLVYF